MGRITTVATFEITVDKPAVNSIPSSRSSMASGDWNGLHVVAVGGIDSQDLVRTLQFLL